MRSLVTLGLAALTALAALGAAPAPAQERAKATFAGGCFWCMEPPFDKLDGVISTTSGYTGGRKANPTYEEVSAGTTGHTEAVEIVYDPRKVTYARLLEVFWRNIDPSTADRQFCDVGSQYRAAIFYHDEAQRRLAEQSKQAVARAPPAPDRDRGRSRPRRSTSRRTITRTITRRTRSATGTTGRAAAATSAWSRSGGRTPSSPCSARAAEPARARIRTGEATM